MLPKQKRLTRSEFSRFFVSGKRMHTPEFQILYAPFPTQRAAVVVGKKVHKKAVDRNHLRRQVYHIVRDWFTATDKTGVYIIIAKPAARSLNYQALQEQLIPALESCR